MGLDAAPLARHPALPMIIYNLIHTIPRMPTPLTYPCMKVNNGLSEQPPCPASTHPPPTPAPLLQAVKADDDDAAPQAADTAATLDPITPGGQPVLEEKAAVVHGEPGVYALQVSGASRGVWV